MLYRIHDMSRDAPHPPKNVTPPTRLSSSENTSTYLCSAQSLSPSTPPSSSPNSHRPTMSKAIISPSVLAVSPRSGAAPGAHPADARSPQSDLSNLTSECKRMMANGCDWLHMGECRAASTYLFPLTPPPRCHGWVNRFAPHAPLLHTHTLLSQPLCSQHHHGRANLVLRQKGSSRHLHGLPHDGR